MNRLACLLILPFSCATAFAQSSTYVYGDASRTIKWDDMVNTLVEVDGLAWGGYSKGLGAHLCLPAGKVYLRGLDLVKSDNNGRLLRISGVLRKAQTAKVKGGVQGYSQSFDYFYIETLEATRIERIVLDQLLPSKHAWITQGLQMERAETLIQSRGLTKYGLALAAPPDGSKAHSYKLNETELLVFYEFNGRVKSVAKVRIKNPTKSGLEWSSVLGCR